MEEENSGLTLGQVLKCSIGLTKKRKITFALVAVTSCITISLGLLLGYNTLKTDYTSSFAYNINGFDGSTYLNGESFNTRDLINKKNLNAVKSSNEAFSGIDVDSIIEDSAISITLNDTAKDLNALPYTITVKKRYFPSKDVAREFVRAIAETPVRETNDILNVLDLNKYAKNYKETSTTYSEMISKLIDQAGYINSQYTSLVEKYLDPTISSVTISSLGDSLSLIQVKNYVSSQISELNISDLNGELEKNSYVYQYDKYKSIIDIKINAIDQEIAKLDCSIKLLQKEIDDQIAKYNKDNKDNLTAPIETLNSELAPLLTKKGELQYEKSVCEAQIANGNTDSKAFEDKLEDKYNSLITLTNDLTKVEKELYTKRQDVNFETNSVIKENGGVKSYVGIAIAVVGGLIIASCVNLCMDLGKYKKQIIEEEMAAKEEKNK